MDQEICEGSEALQNISVKTQEDIDLETAHNHLSRNISTAAQDLNSEVDKEKDSESEGTLLTILSKNEEFQENETASLAISERFVNSITAVEVNSNLATKVTSENRKTAVQLGGPVAKGKQNGAGQTRVYTQFKVERQDECITTVQEDFEKVVDLTSLKEKNCDQEQAKEDETHQLSQGDKEARTGKMKYTVFPTSAVPQSNLSTVLKDFTDAQLLRYLQEEFFESEKILSRETTTSKENIAQEDIPDELEFVEISLEEEEEESSNNVSKFTSNDTTTTKHEETVSISSKDHGKFCCITRCFKRFRCTSSTKN